MMDQPFLRLALSVHAAALRLYPDDFRAAFGKEMQAVFALTATEASDEGMLNLGNLFLREMRDLFWSALSENRQGNRSRAADGTQPRDFAARFSHTEMLISLAVFLIPAGTLLLSATAHTGAGELIPRLMLACLILGLVAGLLKRFPPWSLPYLGLVFSAIVFVNLFQWRAERIATAMASRFVLHANDELGRLLLTGFWQGVVWLSLFVLIGLLVLLLRLIPPCRPWVRRLRDDWTQLSYLLYGSSILAVSLTFEGYSAEKTPFILAALVCMAAGAWSYLHSSRPQQGFLALMAGATMAMWVAAAGVWLLVPRQEWAAWFSAHPPDTERWFEVGQTLIAWFWMLVVMALPALVKLIPKTPGARSVR
jgi:hypothetical protein